MEGFSERVHQVMIKYATAMCPHTTLRRLLVHPKDNVELAEQGDLVYQTPGNNCGAEYIGETAENATVRTQEERKQHEQ